MTERQGTAAWMAPELEPECNGSNVTVEYSFGVDCYSFGIVLFEIIAGRHPWAKIQFSSQIIDKVVSGERPKLFDQEVEACKEAGCEWMLDLMKSCWQQD